MSEIKKWYQKSGNESDVVLSTRIRLARNLKRFAFGDKCSLEDKLEICKNARDAVFVSNSVLAAEFNYYELNRLDENELISFAEKHLVSPEFISNTEGKALLISKDESIAIMINEEDHIRIQIIKEGLCLKEAFETADRVDSLLNEHLDFAYDEEFGYLTCCPTNLGTGMRASVMLHLPAMGEQGLISRIGANLSKLGMTIRGSYGEGSRVYGSLYQLSNQITLGLSELSALDNLLSVIIPIISEERKLREIIKTDISLQDKILRSAGLLKSARLFTSGELTDLISNIRLGVTTGIITGIDFDTLNELQVVSQPATLMCKNGKNLSQDERNIIRATMAREYCKNIEE